MCASRRGLRESRRVRQRSTGVVRFDGADHEFPLRLGAADHQADLSRDFAVDEQDGVIAKAGLVDRSQGLLHVPRTTVALGRCGQEQEHTSSVARFASVRP